MQVLKIGSEFAGGIVMSINRDKTITVSFPGNGSKDFSFADVEHWFFSGEFV